MRYLRWIHKTWNFFWTFIGVLVLSVVLVCGIVFGAMQLQPVKHLLSEEIEQRFNQQYNGVLSIGEIDGLLPVLFQLKDVRIYSDSSEFEPVFEASAVDANFDVFSVFRKQVIVKGLRMENPDIIVDPESSFSIEHALTASNNIQNDQKEGTGDPIFQFLMPSVKIDNGRVLLRNVFNSEIGGVKVDTLTVQNVDLSMFFEFTEEQRFLDIDRLSFRVPELGITDGQLFGQVYNDEQYLEFNAFNIHLDKSRIKISGEADGVDLLKGNIEGQLTSSKINIDISDIDIAPGSIRKILPGFPYFQNYIQGSLNGEGTFDSFWFENIDLSTGESFVYGSGYLINLLNNPDINYGFTIERAAFSNNEITLLPLELNQKQVEAITQLHLAGDFKGTLNNLSGNLVALSERGSIQFDGDLSLAQEHAFDLFIQTDSLDLGGLVDSRIQRTDLSFEGEVKSTSLDFMNSEGGLAFTFEGGAFDHREFDQISIITQWKDGFFEPNLNLSLNGSMLTAKGWVDLKQEQNEFSIQGNARNFEINEWLKFEGMNSTVADLDYDVFLKGNSLNELHGQLSVDIPKAIVGTDTLASHQFYLDFNEPESTSRMLRFTSTAFDATLEGSYSPTNLIALSEHWGNYFEERFKEEILLQDTNPSDTSKLNIASQIVALSGRLKNVNLIKAYFPDFPSFNSSANLNSTITIDSDRLLFNASLQDPLVTFDNNQVDSLSVQVTGGFRYGNKFKEFSELQLQANAVFADFKFLDARGVDVFAELNQDSIFIRNNVEDLAGNADFILETNGRLQNELLAFNIDKLSYGKDQYQWLNEGDPKVEYTADEKLSFFDFSFRNEEQFVRVNGTISDDVADSVNYEIGGVKLDRISRLLDRRLSFGGILDGVFTTRTLTTVPTIQGDIYVDQFVMEGNTVGDIDLSSRYNSQLNRFDTEIHVSTDSAKYPHYYTNNDRRGQEFDINGYVLAPRNGDFPDVDSLFVFDVDFENIDMWILPYIGPKIFTEGAGLSDGTGKIWGNLHTYDFHADFNVGTDDAVYLRPRFLDTYYYAQGGITFTRDEGLVFNDIYLIDPSGGNAILSGFFDFNDFQPLSYVGIKLEMDEFQFLNSSFEASAPFYGNAYGTSTVTITGTNLNPVLSSESPIILSDFSEIGIPLLEETEFNEDNKFIRFVNNFDVHIDSTKRQVNVRNRNILEPLNQDDVDLSFAERFTLDLQFEAYDPMTVQLIFDPVTGDVVTADGTGRMRIRLEDEQVSMFGRFDITGGRYQFVSGDIFSRRFELDSGGSITWEGDPANARLNLNAIYRARPDINTLTTSRSEINSENSQRVPVELVLNIGGTISSIENNFYFRLPETFESRQSSTLATQLASLNRDEELKLIQSANFLLMGDFIPVSDTQNSLFGENLSGSAAVLNPLLSSQVISPLLSNQMNSLLNSDLSSLDVDFNLNTYNQVDLGVALRLYNDKLIFRREGQITGRQSNIGDLGATYRINRTFAVTAFHRQDPTFGNLSSTEQSQHSQDINGLGVEAKFSFNTWKGFFNKLLSPIRNLFGLNKTEEESITENKEGGNPS
ncbi:MAG: hypothetical protein WD059_15225 [Balneolaceae bacterium]